MRRVDPSGSRCCLQSVRQTSVIANQVINSNSDLFGQGDNPQSRNYKIHSNLLLMVSKQYDSFHIHRNIGKPRWAFLLPFGARIQGK